MISHTGVARRHVGTKKEEWLRQILARGLTPDVLTLEVVPVEESAATERKWAQTFLNAGPLLNHARVGAGNPGVGRVEWTDELLSLLGKISDSRLASMIGCSRKTVSYKRECLKIPASFDRTNMKPPPPKAGWNKASLSQSVIDRLGKLPDYVLANEAGVSKPVIRRERIARRIPDYASQTGNDGRMKVGRAHPRWVEREVRQNQRADVDPIDFLTDDVWNAVEPLFPAPPKHGRLDIDNRTALRGVLWVLWSGIKWVDVPSTIKVGAGTNLYRRLCKWIEAGAWPAIQAELIRHLADASFDWSRAKSPRKT